MCFHFCAILTPNLATWKTQTDFDLRIFASISRYLYRVAIHFHVVVKRTFLTILTDLRGFYSICHFQPRSTSSLAIFELENVLHKLVIGRIVVFGMHMSTSAVLCTFQEIIVGPEDRCILIGLLRWTGWSKGWGLDELDQAKGSLFIQILKNPLVFLAFFLQIPPFTSIQPFWKPLFLPSGTCEAPQGGRGADALGTSPKFTARKATVLDSCANRSWNLKVLLLLVRGMLQVGGESPRLGCFWGWDVGA